MYQYEGSELQKDRIAKNECRCGSQGNVYDLTVLLRNGRIVEPPQMMSSLSTPKVRRSRTEPAPIGSGYGKTYIFAVDEDLECHAAPDNERRLVEAVKHETYSTIVTCLPPGRFVSKTERYPH